MVSLSRTLCSSCIPDRTCHHPKIYLKALFLLVKCKEKAELSYLKFNTFYLLAMLLDKKSVAKFLVCMVFKEIKKLIE